MGRKQVNESEKYSLRGKMVSGREEQSELGSQNISGRENWMNEINESGNYGSMEK